MNPANAVTGSWKTSIFGVASLLGGICAIVAQFVGDSPVDWSIVSAGLTSIATGIGLLFAKDYNVSNSPKPLTEAQTVEAPKSPKAN